MMNGPNVPDGAGELLDSDDDTANQMANGDKEGGWWFVLTAPGLSISHFSCLYLTAEGERTQPLHVVSPVQDEQVAPTCW